MCRWAAGSNVLEKTARQTCVLVCEDEMFVAMMLQDRLEHVGYRVLMAARVEKGLEMASAEPVDVALLDINLAGEDSFPIAEKLRARGVPFLFSSGYGTQGLPEAWQGTKILQKPYDTKELTVALAALLET
jgi:DNA-binding response OmpR family regulator